MSRVAALDHLRVLGVQRHAPDELARALAGGEDLVRPGVVVGEQARVGAAERDDHRAGQRRQVDQPLGAEVDRVGEAVGQHEPALGVGVVDLDRHAGLGAHDVAGLDRAARRAGSRSRRSRPRPAPAGSSARDRADGLEHRGAARHVELHLVHLRRGLDRDPAGVERHGLADEAQQRPGDVGRLVADRDQPRVLVGAAARRAANAPIPAASMPARSSTSTRHARRAPARARPARSA